MGIKWDSISELMFPSSPQINSESLRGGEADLGLWTSPHPNSTCRYRPATRKHHPKSFRDSFEVVFVEFSLCQPPCRKKALDEVENRVATAAPTELQHWGRELLDK